MKIKLTWLHFLTKYLETNHDGDWKRHDGTFESIEWKDGVTPPLEADVNVEVKVIEDAWTAQQYARDRKEEYNLLNQFELISDDTINGTSTHKDAIEAIKVKYPKP